MQKFVHERNDEIILKKENLFHIIPIKKLRETNSVDFNIMPVFPEVNGIDVVTHKSEAYSPSLPNGDSDVWYMHPHQEDNLLILSGERIIELYNPETKSIEEFIFSPNKVIHNGKIVHQGPAIIGWSQNVFHKNHSPKGSVCMNFAVRNEHFDVDTEFNIYKLDKQTGEMEVMRKGSEDQKV